MRTLLAPLVFLAALACADPIDGGDDAATPTDATTADLGIDAGSTDLGSTPDAAEDAGVADADADLPDAVAGDADLDAGPAPFPIKVAYSAGAETPVLVELYLTDTSTSRFKVNGPMLGGPAGGDKGPPFAGLSEFYWTAGGEALVYRAQQDAFDRYELYAADAAGPRPRAPRKLSLPNAQSEASFEGFAPSGRRLAFEQLPAGRTFSELYVVSATAASVFSAINQGSAAPPKWSPTQDQFVFFDIIQSMNDRDLWFADLNGAPPFRTERVNPGANLGFNASAAWSADGRRLLYVADESALRLFELFVVDITAGALGPRTRVHPALATNRDVQAGQETIGFSPDGRYAGYALAAVVNPALAAEVFVVDLSSSPFGAPVSVSGPLPVSSRGLSRLRFSVDNAHLYYLADQDTPNSPELYWASLSGGSPVRLNDALPANAEVLDFLELPAGPTILFRAGTFSSSSLYWVDLSAGSPSAPVLLYTTQGNELVEDYDVSPAGDLVVFRVHDRDLEQHSLHLVDLSGATPSPPRTLAGPGIENCWCWDGAGRLAFGADLEAPGTGELYLLDDPKADSPRRISGPVQAGGRVHACAFPPN